MGKRRFPEKEKKKNAGAVAKFQGKVIFLKETGKWTIRWLMGYDLLLVPSNPQMGYIPFSLGGLPLNTEDILSYITEVNLFGEHIIIIQK